VGKEHTGAYRGFYYSLLGYAKMSRNEIEAWDRWVGPEALGPRRQQTGIVAQPRAIGPAKLVRVYWPGSALKDEIKKRDISGATMESIPVDNVSRPSGEGPFSA
jgi:hypothetical protein